MKRTYRMRQENQSADAIDDMSEDESSEEEVKTKKKKLKVIKY